MSVRILTGDCRALLKTLPDASVHTCVTSPPYYGLRSYGIGTENGEMGLENSPDEWIAGMVGVFREVRRILRPDGTLWCNVGDSYNANQGSGFNANAGKPTASPKAYSGLAPKQLLMMPARLALALQADGWWLRSDIIWAKPNPMPESVTDRPTSAHEHIFLLSRSPRYYYDSAAIAEEAIYADSGRTSHERGFFNGKGAPMPGREPFRAITQSRNARNVWTIATEAFPEAHFATFPTELAERCIKAGCPKDGTVLDPFAGAGTTCLVADRLQRHSIGIELNPAYAAMARNRITQDAGMFAEVAD